jgi:hypothetical protein
MGTTKIGAFNLAPDIAAKMLSAAKAQSRTGQRSSIIFIISSAHVTGLAIALIVAARLLYPLEVEPTSEPRVTPLRVDEGRKRILLIAKWVRCFFAQ